MDLYHGTLGHYEAFDLSHKGEGEGASLLIGHGVYLTESPLVADAYRQRTADPRYDHTVHSVWDGERRMTLDEAGSEDTEHYERQYGSVFKVGGVTPDALIVWEGTVDDQPFDVLACLRDLYDPSELDAIEAFIEEAEEAEDISMQFDVEEVVEKVMLYGPSYTRELMLDCSREDVKWDQLVSLVANRTLGIPMDDDNAGMVLYGLVEAHTGSEELAAEWFSDRGIHGVIAHLELPLGDEIPHGHENARTVVYWHLSDLAIEKALSPSELQAHYLNTPEMESPSQGIEFDSSPSF